MKMTPLILIILGVSGVYADSHTLRYHETGVSSAGIGLPVYSEVGYVDDQVIANYNSDTHQFLPKTEWMKNLGSEYWERNTQRGQNNEGWYKHNLQRLMGRFNQTGGIHFWQRMAVCELKDDGTTDGYYQFGYDGKDFMHLDTKNALWIPTVNEAQITTQRWNSPDLRMGERSKNYLENVCIPWLKKYIEYGREDLEKRVRPKVKVWGGCRSDDVMRLHCLVYGFHPRAVHVKWVKNGVDDVPSDEMSPILPHPDGTYQIRVSAEVPIREGDTYACHVDHSSIEEAHFVKWDPPGIGLPVSEITGTVFGILAFFAVIIAVVLWIKKKNTGYDSTNTSDTTSETTSDSSNQAKA